MTVALIMGLDNILDQLEGWSVDFGASAVVTRCSTTSRSSASRAGTLRGGGASAATTSLHYTIIGGEVVASTPNFLGADPAVSPLLGPHLHRPLAAAEDLGRELFRALDEPRRARALVSPVAPTDLVGCNRPHLAPATGRCRSPTSFADGSKAGSPSSWPTCRPSWKRRSASRKLTSMP